MEILRRLLNTNKIAIARLFQIGSNNYEGSLSIEKDEILKYLPAHPKIIDCGAHIGTDAIEFLIKADCRIYAFEPITNIYDKLLANTKQYSNINCFNLALNSYDGVAEMYVSSGYSDGSSSLLEPKMHLKFHPDVFFHETELVNCNKLDTWAIANSVSEIDLLWLDMQGAEKQMLSESELILDTVKVIHTEISFFEIYANMSNYKNLKKFLKKKGFKVVIEAIPKGNYGGNVLFVKE